MNDAEFLQLTRAIINMLAVGTIVIYFANSVMHSQTGQVVPDTIDYLVPLGALLVLKVRS